MSEQDNEVVDVEVPDNVVIQCPKQRFALVKAVGCIACDYGQGLIEVTEADVQWSDKYRIQCSQPIARRTQMVGG